MTNSTIRRAPDAGQANPGERILETDNSRRKYSSQNNKGMRILEVPAETVAAIRKTHPLEALILDICVEDGRVVIVGSEVFK